MNTFEAERIKFMKQLRHNLALIFMGLRADQNIKATDFCMRFKWWFHIIAF